MNISKSEYQDVYDFMRDCFNDFCEVDRSVGIMGASDSQAELINEIMEFIKSKNPDLTK